MWARESRGGDGEGMSKDDDYDYLDPGLCEADPHGELLPHEDVWVVSLAETSLQLVQLARTEPERYHTAHLCSTANICIRIKIRLGII